MMSKRHILRNLLLSLLISLLIGCGGKEERKAKYMEEGKKLFQEGNYEKATLAFKNVLQIDPKDIESRFQMAESLSKRGEIQAAVGHYMAVVTEDPKHVMSRVRMGQVFLMIKKLDDAEKMAIEALANDPANPEVIVLMAGVLAAQNKTEAAITKAQEALQKKPDDVSATMLIASLNARAGKIDEAIAGLKTNIDKNPDKTAPRLMLASLYVQTKAMDKAEETLAGVVKVEPKVLENRKRMAMFYMSSKAVEKAETVLRDAVKDLPEDEAAKLMLIEFLATQRTPEVAVAELMPMIEANPKNYDLRFKLADLQMAQKQITKVEETLKEVVELDKLGPKALIARNKLARLYLALKRTDESKELVKEVIAENPRDADALTLRGEYALAENRLPEAIGDFRAVLVDQPQNIKVLRLLSAAHLKSKETNLARETMEKIIDIAPGDEAGRLDLVNLLFQLGNKDQAMQQIDKLLEKKPNSKPGLEALFKIHLSQKQWGQAQQSATKIQQAYPTEALGFYLSGLGYQAEGAFDKSIASFEQAIEKQPDTVEPLAQLVKSYLTLKQSDKALKKLSDVIQKQPKNFIAFNLKGGIYASDKKFTEAVDAYKQAIKLKPDWPNSYRNLAIVYLIQKNKEEAIKTLSTGIADTKGSMELISDLASLYSRDGEHQKVLALYEDFYKQHPDSLLAANNLASYISDFSDDKASLERAAKLAEPLAKTNNPEMLDTVAWIAYKQGDYQQAQTHLVKALELSPNSPVSAYHLGMVYFKQGDKVKAREYLEKAVNSKAEFSGLAEAKETLKSIVESK